MREGNHYSYRTLLLASVAGIVLGGGTRAASFNNTTPAIGTGDSLNNSSTIASTAPFGVAVSVDAAGALAITNSGSIYGAQAGILIGLGDSIATITSSGTIAANFGLTGGLQVAGTVTAFTNSGVVDNTGGFAAGVDVLGSGTVASITNAAGGTIQASGGSASAIMVDGNVASILNAGTLQATGGSANAIALTGGSIGVITNSGEMALTWTAIDVSGGSLGTISNSGLIETAWTTINVAGGSVGTISNSGLIMASGFGTAIAVGSTGAIGSIINAGGTIQSAFGNAIEVGGTSNPAGSIGTVANTGLIQTVGSFAAIEIGPTGTIGAIANNLGGTIVATGVTVAAIDVSGTAGAISNRWLIETTGGGAAINVAPGGTIGSILNTGGAIETANGGNAILVAGAGAAIGTVGNSGLIQSSGTSAAIEVGPAGTIGSITNDTGGTIGTGDFGNAILVGATSGTVAAIGTLSNTGLIQSAGFFSAIEVGRTGTIASIVNNAGGIIQTFDAAADAIDVAGAIGTISNAGTVQTLEGYAIQVEPGGSIGNITNGIGTIQTVYEGNAILVGGTSGLASSVGTIANAGLIQANDAALQIDATGRITSIVNAAGGTIQTNTAATDAIDIAGTVGTIMNAGLMQALDVSNIDTAGSGINVDSGGSVGEIGNTGTIQSGPIISASGGVGAITVAGTVTAIGNSGLISAGGFNAVAIAVSGTVGSITNTAGGTIAASPGLDGAVVVSGSLGSIANAAGGTIEGSNGIIATGTIRSITNAGLLQSTGDGAAIEAGFFPAETGGTIGSVVNAAGGIIQAGSNGIAIQIFGTAGSIINDAGGTIQAASEGFGIGVFTLGGGAGQLGSIVNAGLIQSVEADAIFASGTATIGTIINNAGGIIQSSGTGGVAIDVAGSVGTIGNSGLIQTVNSDRPVLEVEFAGSVAAVVNNAGGTIQTTDPGVAIRIDGTVGSITNNAGGLIQNTVQGNAIYVVGSAGATGLLGTIVNAGLIQSAGDPAILAGGTATIGAITNEAGGTIQGIGTIGAAIRAEGTIGAIANAGLLRATAMAGIVVAPTGTIGSITNNVSGTIQGTGIGSSALLDSGTIGNIVNSGTMIAPLGTAIAMGTGGLVGNGITNTATGLIQGGDSSGDGVAIDNSTNPHAITIDTAGRIVGAIRLGAAGDTLTVTGGSITGAIIGQPGGNDTLNFSLTGSFATAGSIANVDSINATAGMLVLQNPVSSAVAFTVASGAAVALNATVGAASFRNAGEVTVGTGNPTITGNYTQASTGTLGVTVTGTTSGRLTVTGSASILGGADAVSVHVPLTTDAFGLVGQSEHVLTAGTLSIADPGALTATSDNAGISFALTDPPTDLVLTGQAQTASQAQYAANTDVGLIFAPVMSVATTNDIAVQHFLAQALAGLSLSGQAPVAHGIDTSLSTLAPGALVQFERQLAPSTLFTTSLNLAAAADALSSGLGAISDRLTAVRLDPAQTGLAAGNTVGRGISVWGQPFGALTSQDPRDGIDGYSVASYGVTLGGDMLVREDLRLGVALTLGNSDVSFSGYTAGSNGSIFSSQLALYGAWYRQSFFLDGAVAFGYNRYQRHDVVSALGIALDSSSGGTEISGRLGAGYDWKLNGAVLTPYASVQQVHFNFDGYTTSGGAADGVDMHVNGANADLTQTRLGGRLAYPVTLRDGGTLIPEFHAYYLHDFGDNEVTATYTTSDVAGPGTFAVIGAPVDRNIYNLGVGVTLLRTAAWSFSGGYDYAGRASSTQHNFFVRARLNF